MTDRFLYFDLGNVLLNFDHRRACRQMAEVSGADPEQIWRFVFESDLELRYEAGAITTDQFYHVFCEQTGTKPDRTALIDAAAAIFELNVPIVPLVTQLAVAGHRLGVLSNTNEIHWDYCTSSQACEAPASEGGKASEPRPSPFTRFALLTDCFEVLALSFQLKCCKPDPEIYRAAADLAGVPPSQIFFVDDRPENVAGAAAAGFDAVRYTSVPELASELRRRNIRCNY